MPEEQERWHVSSAVVVTRPGAEESVGAALAAMENVEVYAAEGGKMVVVIEGRSSGAMGAALADIAALSGVVAANMVFEHAEQEEAFADEGRTDAA